MSLRSICVMAGMGRSGVKCCDTGLWSSVNVCSGVKSHTSLSGSLTDESAKTLATGRPGANIKVW